MSENTGRGILRKGATKRKGGIRVALVDDDRETRLLWKDILEQTGACACVGSFSDAAEALTSIPKLIPDVVLMDIQMPGLDGIECTKKLKQISPDVKVIIVTGFHDVTLMNESLQAGADAYLLKPITADQCLATIKFALGGRGGASPLLTARERQVMLGLVQGLLYKEIAEKLGLSYSAVHKYQHKIFLKFQATNRSEAIQKWHKLSGD